MEKIQETDFYKRHLAIINILLFLVIIVLVVIIISDGEKSKIKQSITRDTNDFFPLTNPILDCENNISGDELVVQSKAIREKVFDLKDKYSIDHVSLYFRDMNNGPWIGINEKEEFSPASLLKVPIMMAFLREAEDNPSLLNRNVIIKDGHLNKTFIPNVVFDNLLEIGKNYTLLQATESMIKNSDNTGVIILLENIKFSYLKGVFDSISVPFKDSTTEVPIRVKDYAGFFRVLYNSSYLNREMSEKALEILSEGGYMNGLRKGVPSEVLVAHKFGERTIDGSIDNIQLHDCGIVYYPTKPYLLCIMTRGDSFINQEKVIAELSSFVYKEIDKIKDQN